MRKIVYFILSFSLVLSAIGFAVAQENEKIKEKPKVIQRTGEVAAIDVAARSLTLKPLKYKEEIIVTISENTLVKMRKEKKSLTDVKVGDTVVVWFFEKDKTAKSIEIKPADTDNKGLAPAKPALKK